MSNYYRKIFPRIWNDEKFRTLSGEQQRIAFYILTAQSNRIGLFAFSVGKACEEMQLSRKLFTKGFEQVCRTLNWQWDAAARVIWLPTWWRYNSPESWKNIKGNLKDLDDLPATTLLAQFAANTTDLSEDIKSTFTEVLDQALDKASLSRPHTHTKPLASQKQYQNQKQEQKQEQEQEQESQDTLPPPDYFLFIEEVKDRWNKIPGVQLCADIDGALKSRLEALCKEKPKEWWEKLFTAVTNARYLTGRTAAQEGKDLPFRADLGWVIDPNHYGNILSGKYSDGASPGQCQNSIQKNGHKKSVLCLDHVYEPTGDQPASPEPYCSNCYHAWLARHLEQQEVNRRLQEETNRRYGEKPRLSPEELLKQQELQVKLQELRATRMTERTKRP